MFVLYPTFNKNHSLHLLRPLPPDDSILERGNRASKSYARDNCHYCDEDKPLWFNAARLIGVEDGLHQKRRLLRCFGDDA